jgi:hypothetical protein
MIRLSLLSLLVVVASAEGQTISGRLLESGSDRPIELGTIEVFTESGETVGAVLSGARGLFSITSPIGGAFRLVANAYGYRLAHAGIFEVGPDSEITLDVRLVPEPLALEALVVGFNRPLLRHPLVLNGFVDRFGEGFGLFITPADIARSPARTTPDLFRGFPGITLRAPTLRLADEKLGDAGALSYLGDQIMLLGPSGWCTPTLYLDGARLRYEGEVSIDALLPVNSIDGVEIYRRPSETPLMFNATRGPSEGSTVPCGVVVFWTKKR